MCDTCTQLLAAQLMSLYTCVLPRRILIIHTYIHYIHMLLMYQIGSSTARKHIHVRAFSQHAYDTYIIDTYDAYTILVAVHLRSSYMFGLAHRILTIHTVHTQETYTKLSAAHKLTHVRASSQNPYDYSKWSF